jgi:phosphoribosyl-ATP pyrophosphohydrolase/phosphoribosyl-ATP pyrophosphohydrolase/phosphoribosyl-AMP cyclohydrolase
VEIFKALSDVVEERKISPQAGSYTNKLLDGGENIIIKKLGEENAEFIRALISGSDIEAASEAADYIYHMIVALRYRDIGFEKVAAVLRERHK